MNKIHVLAILTGFFLLLGLNPVKSENPPDSVLIEKIPFLENFSSRLQYVPSPPPEQNARLLLAECINRIMAYYKKEALTVKSGSKLEDFKADLEERELMLYEIRQPQPKFLQAVVMEKIPVLTVCRLKKVIRSVQATSTHTFISRFSPLLFDLIIGSKNRLLNTQTVQTRSWGNDYEICEFTFITRVGNTYPSKVPLKNYWGETSSFKRTLDLKPSRHIIYSYLILPKNEQLPALLEKIEDSHYTNLDKSYVFPKIAIMY